MFVQCATASGRSRLLRRQGPRRLVPPFAAKPRFGRSPSSSLLLSLASHSGTSPHALAQQSVRSNTPTLSGRRAGDSDRRVSTARTTCSASRPRRSCAAIALFEGSFLLRNAASAVVRSFQAPTSRVRSLDRLVDAHLLGFEVRDVRRARFLMSELVRAVGPRPAGRYAKDSVRHPSRPATSGIASGWGRRDLARVARFAALDYEMRRELVTTR